MSYQQLSNLTRIHCHALLWCNVVKVGLLMACMFIICLLLPLIANILFFSLSLSPFLDVLMIISLWQMLQLYFSIKTLTNQPLIIGLLHIQLFLFSAISFLIFVLSYFFLVCLCLSVGICLMMFLVIVLKEGHRKTWK